MNKLEEILIKISNLLKDNDEVEVAKTFERLCKEAVQYNGDYDVDFIIKVKSLFSGMGSFNDLVLHKDSRPLIKENDELDRLKNELYEKCKELRLAKYKGEITDF
jgi:hypothetical protein